jgi:hypothetical protein
MGDSMVRTTQALVPGPGNGSTSDGVTNPSE